MKSTIIYSFLFILLISACTNPPDYPTEPIIEFSHLSKNTMVQSFNNSDTVYMTVSFTDGDGDLGTQDDSLDIFLTDTRLDAGPLKYKLPFVPLQGTGNGISGDITVLLPATCCIFPNNIAPPCDNSVSDLYPTDTMTYEVFIRDRAGNESNRIETDEIIILCN